MTRFASALFSILCMAAQVALPAAAQDNPDPLNVPPDVLEHRPSENVARGATYTLQPPPNYELCTDAGDATQITDGVYTEGSFWGQKTTVGWSKVEPVIVVIDLGEIRPIRGASLRTAAGSSDVTWPLMILMLVADEPGQFHAAGDLVKLSASRGLPDPQTYATHRYWTDELHTHGRYVAFVAAAQPFFFVDEIEVYAGDSSWLDEPLSGPVITDVEQHAAGMTVLAAVQRRLHQDVQYLAEKLGNAAISPEDRAALVAELDELDGEIDAFAATYGPEFRAVLPLNDLHERIFQVQAGCWRAQRLDGIITWPADLWGPISHFAEPEPVEAFVLEVHTMRNEYRAAAFNMSNATTAPATLELRIEGLPGMSNPPYVRVSEVAWTDTNSGVPVAAALPAAQRKDDAYLINIPAGMTRQVWLTAHLPDVEPGLHQGRIDARGESQVLSIPLRLQVYPLQFPDRPALHFGGWDYTDTETQYEVTPENRGPLVAMLKDYFVDSPWGTSAVMPLGSFDDSGQMTVAPDTTRFDEWVELWAGARQYLVFAAHGHRTPPFPLGTPAFERAVQAWARFWADHARTNDIDPTQIGLLILDEPHNAEQQEIILAWARAIEAAGTGLRVWEDPTFRDLSVAIPEMVAACDVVCPNRPIFLSGTDEYRQFFRNHQDAGVTLEFYSCSGPALLLDPYRYHRLQAWDCWRFDAKASYFWAFADSAGASTWNEYTAKHGGYTPLFIDATSVTPGKHLEACREGIEDYEYLVMLRDTTEKYAAQNGDAALLERARHVLDEGPRQVCQPGRVPSFRWRDPTDRTVADHVRIEILSVLSSMQAAMSEAS